MTTKLKVQVQKTVKGKSSGLIQTVGGDDSVLVTLTVESHGRAAAERVFAAIADFSEKLNAGDS